MKNIFIGLVVLILIFFGIAYFMVTDTSDEPEGSTPTNENTQDEPISSGDNNDEVSIPDNFRLHGEPDSGYSIALPFAVDVASPQSGIARYRYVGLNNEPGSEITDGYTITVTSRSAVATSAAALAAQEIQGGRTSVLEGPVMDQLSGERASRYTTESELGNNQIEHYALVPGNGFEYIISINLSPNETTQYKQEVDAILETLTFLNGSEVASLASRIIPIAMLDYDSFDDQYIKESGGIERGCDKVVIIDHVLEETTTTPLNASLAQLFAYNSDTVAGWQNFIASQDKTLSFDRAEITDGTAQIYLTGELGPLGGACDNPRAAIQIEETALSYSTIDSVQLYLNGEPTDLIPNGRGD